MKRILKYIWLWGLLSLCVSSCEEEAAVINPDVSHDKPTEVVIGDSPRLCSELQTDNQRFIFISEKSYEKERYQDEKIQTDCIYTYAGIEFDDLCSMWKEEYGYERWEQQ